MSRPAVVSIVLLVAAVLLPAVAPAQNEPMYEAAVPVRDQSPGGRAAGLRDALGAVLVKVTGNRAIAGADHLEPLFESAPRMVQQFRYEQRAIQDPGPGEPATELYLRARFDPAAILRALRDRNIAIWGRERPATLVWLAYDDGLERGLVDGTAPPAIRAAATAAGEARGLPLVWPLLDLEDRAALPFADLWGGFEERITGASTRYRSNAILAGRVYRVDADRWAVRWNLIEDGDSSWTTSGPGALDDVVAAGPHWVADEFARRYALVPTERADGRTRVVVGGITRVGDYAAVMRYLQALSPVAAVEVDAVDGDEVTFALELRGTPQQLQQAIALGTRLVALPQSLEYDAALRYAIRP